MHIPVKKMTLNFQAREKGHFFRVSKQINAARGQSIQWLVQEIISWGETAGIFVLVSLASNIVSAMVAEGVLAVVNKVIESVASPTLVVTGMDYDIKATEPVGGGIVETEGSYFECVAGSKMNKIFTEGYYPQFIKQKDKSIASTFFSYFRDGGYDGVEKFSATITVPYK